MPTSVSIAFNQYPDPAKAALQACVQVKNQLDKPTTDLVIVFASSEYITPEIQPVIARILKPKRLIGSSTGRMLLSHGIAGHGILLIAVNSDDMSFGIAAVDNLDNAGMRTVGFELARKAALDLNSTQREVFLAFSDGIEKNSTQFIRGAKEALGAVFPLLGAISSDDFKYKKLSQLFQDQILHNSAVGLLMGGSFQLALGCKHGFKPLGKPRTVTDAEGFCLRTIDGKPAIDIYKHFFGEHAKDLDKSALNSYAALYPLGIYLEESRQYLLRNVIDILTDGSIVCHEGVPVGAEVHLMISNSESCVHSAVEAAKLAKASLGERQPKLVLVFESLTRQRILGNWAFSEIQSIKNILGNTVPFAGMCSFGEIGPFGTLNNIKNIYVHNESILIIAIS